MQKGETIEGELLEIIRGLKAYMTYQAEIGVKGFERSNSKSADSEVNLLDKDRLTLETIIERMGECTRCDLHKGRRRIVFGAGPENAEIMFVGEAPGAEEDRQGVPFVGRAGQLLTKIVTAMKYSRQEVYITNVNKCRPPKNRDPRPAEVAACEPFLMQQIQVIKPKVIIALGRWAAQTLLKTNTAIGGLRGKFHDYHGIPLMPTYHPAAILRNPNLRRPVWDDMQKVMKLLGKEP